MAFLLNRSRLVTVIKSHPHLSSALQTPNTFKVQHVQLADGCAIHLAVCLCSAFSQPGSLFGSHLPHHFPESRSLVFAICGWQERINTDDTYTMRQ